jgi:3-carboxy-cis,cis-muconate cycloisomerase
MIWMPFRLIESLASTPELAELFSDESILQAMLTFEVALASAEERLGILPSMTAAAIERAVKTGSFISETLAHDAMRAGTPVIPLVKTLTNRVRVFDSGAARYVHWGATSQDVSDTALVLLLKKARPLLAADEARIEHALRALSNQHANTVMLGRTLLQPAPPVTFGLKTAGWQGAIQRGWAHLESAFDEALVLQFGGAAGTLAALGDQGISIGSALAAELGLAYPRAPWHAHRDSLATLVCSCGVLAGSLGKMARDVALLMQGEVREAAEPGGAGRGGSSTMPHKRNPIASSLTLAAAHRLPGLVASFLSGMVQEHERGAGGWHAEWPTIAAAVQATGLALASMAEAVDGLSVDPERMRANIHATGGLIFAERIMMVLGRSLGRDGAHELLQEAAGRSISEGRRLIEVLVEMPEITRLISPEDLRRLDSPETYLGSAEIFRKGLVSPEED